MSEYKIVSDTHFYHQKALEFGTRNFKTVEDMNEHIIKVWNENISLTDKVIHLGDFAFGDDLDAIENIIKRLNGNITLILGNHDTAKKVRELYTRYFKCLGGMSKGKYYFTHEPVHSSVINPDQFRTTGRQASINIHGHLHNNDIENLDYPDKDKYINCCLDVCGIDNFIKTLYIGDKDDK